MKTLQNLLKKYTQIQAPDATLKKAFIKAVEEVIDIQISLEDVRISKKTIKINTPSTIKNEIRINQREILQKVSEEVGDKNALTAIF